MSEAVRIIWPPEPFARLGLLFALRIARRFCAVSGLVLLVVLVVAPAPVVLLGSEPYWLFIRRLFAMVGVTPELRFWLT